MWERPEPARRHQEDFRMGRWNPQPAADQRGGGRTSVQDVAPGGGCNKERAARPFAYAVVVKTLRYLDDERFIFSLADVNERCGVHGRITIRQTTPGDSRYIRIPLAEATLLATVIRHFRKMKKKMGPTETLSQDAWEALPSRSVKFMPNAFVRLGKGKGQFSATGMGVHPTWIGDGPQLSIEIVRERGGVHRCGGEQRVLAGAILQLPMWIAGTFSKYVTSIIQGQ